MYLEAIKVNRYRSIDRLALEPCGDFNVLIGKNSAGKSNILASIDAFFACSSPEIIKLAPPIGELIDFFGKHTVEDVSISAKFRLSEEERAALLADMIADHPQVKHVLDGIDPNARLFVSTRISAPPYQFAYVHKISLLLTEGSQELVIFELDKAAASELFEAAQNVDLAYSNQRQLEKLTNTFDSDDFAQSRRTRTVGPQGGPSPDFFIRRYLTGITDSKLTSDIMKKLSSSDSYETFISEVRQMANTLVAESDAIRAAPIKAAIKIYSGEDHAVPKYVAKLLGRLAKLKILHFRDRRIPIGSDEAKRLLSLKTTRGGPDILSRIQATVSELLGVKVDAFAGEPGRRGESTAELDVDEFLIQVNGSGIREALRLILDTEFEKPHLLLVEEPEIHLHPALETSIMSYLRTVSQGLQVFVTTHSTNFLDTGNFQNVFLVSKDTSTHVTPLTLAEAQEKLPSELGIRLSSLFMFDQIIFVEGPSDEQIIRELARSLGINFGRLNVGFIQMRGVRNIGHYAAAEVISFLTKRQVKLHFLVDSDEANSVHFKRLTEEFGKSAQLHVLRKREIENYLLSPHANIAHLISRKRAGGDAFFQAPSVDTFEAELEICAEKLKPLAIWKRAFAQMAHPI
jgi:predicted ATPase